MTDDIIAQLVARLVGPDPAQDVRVMAEALVKVAVDITHECGTPEATAEACWQTIEGFITAVKVQACIARAKPVSPEDRRCTAASVAPDGGPVRCDRPAGHAGGHEADFSGPPHRGGDLVHRWPIRTIDEAIASLDAALDPSSWPPMLESAWEQLGVAQDACEQIRRIAAPKPPA